MKTLKAIIFCLLPFCITQSIAQILPEKPFPVKILTNGKMKVTILIPDTTSGYYRSTRFDWSGIVAQVEYKGHSYFQNWEHYDGSLKDGIHDPLNNGTGTGTAEEFRIPLSYDDAKPGDPFIKIGVGILEKAENKPHHWAFPYKIINLGKWKIWSAENKISFVQDLNGVVGFGYRYEKQIVLKKNASEITVIHKLTNTGNKSIYTKTYCHNFLRFDNEFIGPDYNIAFSKPIAAISDFSSKATVIGHSFNLNKDLSDSGPVEGDINANASTSFTVTNTKTNTGIVISSDTHPVSFYLYTWRMAFCPEPMIEINVKPGESFVWKTNYKFF
jgi:hypothetical protein